MRSLLLTLLFLCVPLFAYVNPPVSEVSNNNLELAESLLNYSGNIGGVDVNEPSVNNPVIWADMRILTTIPGVDGKISDNHNTSILWAWGEEHSGHEEKSRPNHNGCPDSKTYIDERGSPYLCNLTFTFNYYSLVERIVFGENETPPNPIGVPFGNEKYSEIGLLPDNFTNGYIEPLLKIQLEGAICFPYLRHESYYVLRTVGNSTYCHHVDVYENVVFEEHFNESKNFTVEFGNITEFTLTPILGEQHTTTPTYETVLFSNRKNAKMVYYLNGMPVASTYSHLFNVSEDVFGVQYINISKSNETDLFSTDLDIISPLNLNHTVFSNWSDQFIYPNPLVFGNDSYSKSTYFKLLFESLDNGRHVLGFEFYDFFHDSWEFSKETYIREPTILDFDGQKVRLLGYSGNALSEKQLSVICDGEEKTMMTDSTGSAELPEYVKYISIEFKGDDYFRPSSTSQTSSNPAEFDLRPFLSLCLLLAILAGLGFSHLYG